MSLSEVGSVAERPSKTTKHPTKAEITEMVLRLGADYITKKPDHMYFQPDGSLYPQVGLRDDLGMDSLDAAQLFLDMEEELTVPRIDPDVPEGADDVTMGDLYQVCQAVDE